MPADAGSLRGMGRKIANCQVQSEIDSFAFLVFSGEVAVIF